MHVAWPMAMAGFNVGLGATETICKSLFEVGCLEVTSTVVISAALAYKLVCLTAALCMGR